MNDLAKVNDPVLNNNLILQQVQKLMDMLSPETQTEQKAKSTEPFVMRDKDRAYVEKLYLANGDGWCTYEMMALFMECGVPTVINLLSRARNDDGYIVESMPYKGRTKLYRVRPSHVGDVYGVAV